MVKTKQRELILEAVRASDDHPTADELFHIIRRSLPTISLATVYRNLGILSEQQIIRRIEMPDGRDRFDWRTTEHDHFMCRKCRKIWDFSLSQPLPTLISPEMGFKIEDYALVVRGYCRECAANLPPEEGSPE